MASEQTRRRAAAQAKRTHRASSQAQQSFGVNGLLILGRLHHSQKFVRARSVESSLSVINPGPGGLSTLQLVLSSVTLSRGN
jgi:hypothetical protein